MEEDETVENMEEDATVENVEEDAGDSVMVEMNREAEENFHTDDGGEEVMVDDEENVVMTDVTEGVVGGLEGIVEEEEEDPITADDLEKSFM